MATKHEKWMPLYIGDYLKKTQRLQAEQHGAYLLLLMEAWQSGGSIPDDPEELASIARVPLERWQTHTSAKVLPFFAHRDGRYWSGRVCEELARATAVVEKRAQAGAAGAAARWQTHGKRIASGMAGESQKDAPSPSQPQDELQITSVANPAVSPINKEPRKPKGSRVCPSDWEAPAELIADLKAKHPSLDLAREEAAMRLHEFKPPGYSDWGLVLRRWCANAEAFGAQRQQNGVAPRQRAPHKNAGIADALFLDHLD